jgi:hypothetical protein
MLLPSPLPLMAIESQAELDQPLRPKQPTTRPRLRSLQLSLRLSQRLSRRLLRLLWPLQQP